MRFVFAFVLFCGKSMVSRYEPCNCISFVFPNFSSSNFYIFPYLWMRKLLLLLLPHIVKIATKTVEISSEHCAPVYSQWALCVRARKWCLSFDSNVKEKKIFNNNITVGIIIENEKKTESISIRRKNTHTCYWIENIRNANERRRCWRKKANSTNHDLCAMRMNKNWNKLH